METPVKAAAVEEERMRPYPALAAVVVQVVAAEVRALGVVQEAPASGFSPRPPPWHSRMSPSSSVPPAEAAPAGRDRTVKAEPPARSKTPIAEAVREATAPPEAAEAAALEATPSASRGSAPRDQASTAESSRQTSRVPTWVSPLGRTEPQVLAAPAVSQASPPLMAIQALSASQTRSSSSIEPIVLGAIRPLLSTTPRCNLCGPRRQPKTMSVGAALLTSS
jgi:hypothetical protein